MNLEAFGSLQENFVFFTPCKFDLTYFWAIKKDPKVTSYFVLKHPILIFFISQENMSTNTTNVFLSGHL